MMLLLVSANFHVMNCGIVYLIYANNFFPPVISLKGTLIHEAKYYSSPVSSLNVLLGAAYIYIASWNVDYDGCYWYLSLIVIGLANEILKYCWEYSYLG